MAQLFPGEPIAVAGSGKDVVISGTVTSKYVIDKAADLAAGYVEKKENVVNLLRQQEGVASNQVLLRVRFAEVSRSALQELGASFFTGPGGFHDYVSQVTTQQFPSVNFDEMVRSSTQGPDKWGGGRDTVDATGGKMTFSDFLNIFIFNNKFNVGTLVRALQNKGLFQSLAEPNLVATNGKEASFLAGGEFPYPVLQGGAQGNSVTIMFKEFGIRLNFTPTVLGGDLINLKVRPEVSALDFNNAVIVEGFRVPALSTRRTDTEVELRDGQTFAIAGLLNNTVTSTMSKIPGIGDIPILGWLFKSRALQKNQTELVVMITPQILRRDSTGVSSGLPNMPEPILGPPTKQLQPPPPYVGSPRYPLPGQSTGGRDDAAAATPRPAAPAGSGAAPAGAAAQPSAAGMAPPPAAEAAEPPAPPSLTPEELARERVRYEAMTEEREREEKARVEEERRAAEAAKAAARTLAEEREKAEKLAAEEKKRADKEAAEEKKRQEKAAREQAKRDAEEAKRAAEQAKRDAEIAKKKAVEDEKRAKALAEAAERLRAAEAAYRAEVERATKAKSRGGSGGSQQ
jgi:pilus assembly protein CpaC